MVINKQFNNKFKNKMKKHLEVTAVSEITEDKNSKEYKRVTVKESPALILNPATGEMVAELVQFPKSSSLNQYKENYLPVPEKDFAFDAKVGSMIQGAIVKETVPEYSFESAEGETITTNKASVIVFGDTSDKEAFETATLRAFRNAEHQLARDSFVKEEAQIDLQEEPTEVA